MHTKTMEGLIGARTNVALASTPLRVFKEAENRGDTATMERAMGYINELSDKTEEYKEKADKGMEKDAEEIKEKAELEQEDIIRKRKEEREEFEKRIEENQSKNRDTVEISENGKELRNETIDLEDMNRENRIAGEAATDTIEMEPVTYTETGEVSQNRPESGENISVSV